MMNTRIRDILRRKGEDVYSVGPLATVIDAVNAGEIDRERYESYVRLRDEELA